MFLDSKFKATRQPQSLCKCLGLLLGSVGFLAGANLQHANGQQVVQPNGTVIQPQNQVYQTPIYQAPIYQQPPGYYQNQGQIVQPQTISPAPQQPLPAGPVYRAPVGNQTVPPVAQRVPRQAQPDAQQILDAEQAAYNAEKLALVEKLLEKYKATAAENQDAIERLGSMKQENEELRRRMGELDSSSKSYQSKILTLEEKLAAAGKTNPAAMQETEQLKASYQGVVNQVRNLEAEVKRLTADENSRGQQLLNLQSMNMKLKGEVEAAQKQAMSAVPADGNQAELAELAEQNQQLTTDNEKLEIKLRAAVEEYTKQQADNQDLSQKSQALQDSNQGLRGQIARLSNSLGAGQGSGVVANNLVSSNPIPEAAPAQIDVSSYETEISQLTTKNRQLSERNSEFEDENRALSRQLLSLENQAGQEAVSSQSPANVSAMPAVHPAVAGVIEEKEGGWGLLAWLIPFLAIGLGVAFFVIIKEELHRKPAGAVDRSSHQD